MAEEQVVDNQETQDTNTEPSYSDVELKAMSMGWRPQDQWEGDSADWIDAKEFVGRKPLFDKIESTSRKMKDLEKTLHAFKQHYDRVEQTSYERAIRDLKQQKRAALQEEDATKALQIEDQIEALEENFTEYQQTRAQNLNVPQGPSEVFVRWVQQNDWYAKDVELNKVADALGVAYVQRNPGYTEQEVFDYVTKEVKRRYPDKFQNPARNRASAVDAGTARSGSGPKANSLESQLSQEDKDIMNRFIRAGVMTKEQYLKDYFNK